MFQGWKIDDCARARRASAMMPSRIAPFTLAESVEQIPLPSASVSARRRLPQGEIAGIHWVLVKPEGLYISTPDKAVRQRTPTYFGALTHFCADLGGKVMVVGSPKQRNVMDGVTESRPGSGLETFRPAVRVARKRGVVICFEPLAPSETNFINTAADAIRWQQVPSPAFRIILDVKAMSSRAPIPRIIREIAGVVLPPSTRTTPT